MQRLASEYLSPVPTPIPEAQVKSPPASPDETDLGALLVSRVCHDLISPVAAISNGLEILADEQDAQMREHAMRLIEHSVGQAKARLLFARMAFGAMGSAGAEIDLREVGMSLTNFPVGKAKLDWQSARLRWTRKSSGAVELSAGCRCIPRGGVLTVRVEAPCTRSWFRSCEGLKGTGADIKEGLALATPPED
jgi:histidine phosphotransferase ChpT